MRRQSARPRLVGPLARLSEAAQARFDREADRGLEPLVRAVGVSQFTLEKLRYGGRASAPAVAKVEAWVMRKAAG